MEYISLREREKKIVESLSVVVVGFRVIHTAGDSWFHLLNLDPLFPFFFLIFFIMGSIIIFLSSCGVAINYVFLGCGVFHNFVVDDSIFLFLKIKIILLFNLFLLLFMVSIHFLSLFMSP